MPSCPETAWDRPQPPPASPHEQLRLCLRLTGEALGQPGPSLEHVIQTRMSLTGAGHRPDLARARGEYPRRHRARRDRSHRGRLPGPAGRAGIKAEAIRGTRSADMITAPGWRRPRLTIPAWGSGSSPGSCHLGHPGSTAI